MTDALPFVSVLSLTYNRVANVCELLDALREQTYPRDRYEIIVIDNASTDGTADTIRRQYPEVRLVEVGENLGTFSYGLGVRTAVGEYLILIDDDGLPAHDDWMQQLVLRLVANPRLGAAACTVLSHDTLQIAHDSPKAPSVSFQDDGWLVPAYNGTGVGFRASAVKPIDPFYPLYLFHSWVELRLCTILYDRGWEVRVFPQVQVYHMRPSGGTAPVDSYYGLRNYLWYVWELYPLHYAAWETLRYSLSLLKAVLQGRISFRLCFRALCHALRGLGAPLCQRRAVSGEVIRQLRRMRTEAL